LLACNEKNRIIDKKTQFALGDEQHVHSGSHCARTVIAEASVCPFGITREAPYFIPVMQSPAGLFAHFNLSPRRRYCKRRCQAVGVAKIDLANLA
jgi:hypothetical protein